MIRKEKMNFCQYCGKEIPEGYQLAFCPWCGKKIETKQEIPKNPNNFDTESGKIEEDRSRKNSLDNGVISNKNKSPKKKFPIITCVTAAIVAAAIVSFMMMKRKGQESADVSSTSIESHINI